MSLHGSPERLDLAIGCRRIRQGRLVQDAETRKSLSDLGRRHGGTVVAQACTRQSPLLEGLGEAMRDVLCGLGEVPLQMAGNSGAIIENGEQDWGQQLAAGSEYLLGTKMAVKMNEASHVTGLVAPHLTIEEPGLGAFGAGGSA